MSVIGENISKRRKALGLTQEELAERLGYKSKSSINKIEMGINDLPQRKIAQFADALHTTPAVLMGWVSEEVSSRNDKLVRLIALMREDDSFLSIVDDISNLNDSQRASIVQLLSAFRQQ